MSALSFNYHNLSGQCWTRIGRFVPWASLILIGLLGCSPESEQDSASATSTSDPVLRVVVGEEPTNLDPVRTLNAGAAMLSRQVFQAPYRYQYLSRQDQLRPDLAESMPVVSEDLLTYTIRLRADARFADDPVFPGGVGRRVLASDVAFSLSRHLNPRVTSQWSWLIENRIVGLDEWATAGAPDHPIEGLEVVNDQVLRIRLVRPFPAFVHILASPAAGVVPREAVSHYGDAFGRRPVGSGPYKLVHIDDTVARFERNPGYRELFDLTGEGYSADAWPDLTDLESLDGQSLPFLDQVEVHFVVDDVPAFLMLTQSPPADVAVISTEAKQLWESDPVASHRLVQYPSASVVRFGLNLKGPLGAASEQRSEEDLRLLRCAMARAMDWQERNRIFYQDLATLHPGIIPPYLPGFDPALPLDPVTYDPVAARALLERGHWTSDNLPAITYGYQGGVLDQQGFEHFRAMLTAVGWPAERIQPRVYSSFGALSAAAARSEFDVYLRSWVLDYPDPENLLALYYGPHSPGVNFEGYQNPAFDQRYDQITEMPPGDDRTILVQEMNEMLIHDCVFMGSVFRSNLKAISKNLVYRGDAQASLAGTAWRFAVRRH